MTRRLRVVLLSYVLVLTNLLFAQGTDASRQEAPDVTASGPIAYDVVSIHDHPAGDFGSAWRSTPDGMSMSGIPLRSLASGAYGVKLDLVSGGPAWVEIKPFDITAKVLPGEDGRAVELSDKQRELLFQNLLADRFHLKAHVETRQLPIYDLVVAKGGFKLKPFAPAPASDDDSSHSAKPMSRIYPNRIDAHHYDITSLANQLGYMVHQTVIDKTGLSGSYDFDLTFTPEEVPARAAKDPASGNANLSPDIFTALQEQLGLKLVPTKGPVRTLVIDHADLPSAN